MLVLSWALVSANNPYADQHYGLLSPYPVGAMVRSITFGPVIFGISLIEAAVVPGGCMRVPLNVPTEAPIYVNAMQCEGILRRCCASAKAERANRLVKASKVSCTSQTIN
ncbi:hypothetical protein C2845_PM17G03360 [Panicum miliaceum]|uniref:Uncharacterized protein n=1 Tax=Panicum miliaceum TaxID=4540 RepID=A0A3L6Q4X8_PANMI|nr:hypothetical protein C2845_PM17G03360 [Panicum miliaceum]